MQNAEQKTIILEPSTNTHKLVAKNVDVVDLGNSTLKLTVHGKGIVTHGEHAIIATESKNVFKYVQTEVNPISNAIQKAFD